MALYGGHSFFARIWNSDGTFYGRFLPGKKVGQPCDVRSGRCGRICTVFQYFRAGRICGESAAYCYLSAYRFSVPEKASGGLEAAWILQEMGGGGWHFSEKNFSESFFSICIAAAVRLWGFQRNTALRYRAVPCAEHSLD